MQPYKYFVKNGEKQIVRVAYKHIEKENESSE